jgi:hypothetical protein
MSSITGGAIGIGMVGSSVSTGMDDVRFGGEGGLGAVFFFSPGACARASAMAWTGGGGRTDSGSRATASASSQMYAAPPLDGGASGFASLRGPGGAGSRCRGGGPFGASLRVSLRAGSTAFALGGSGDAAVLALGGSGDTAAFACGGSGDGAAFAGSGDFPSVAPGSVGGSGSVRSASAAALSSGSPAAIGLDPGDAFGVDVGSVAFGLDAGTAAFSTTFGASAVTTSCAFGVGTGAALGTDVRGTAAAGFGVPGSALPPGFGSIARASGRFGSSVAKPPFDAVAVAGATGFVSAGAAAADVTPPVVAGAAALVVVGNGVPVAGAAALVAGMGVPVAVTILVVTGMGVPVAGSGVPVALVNGVPTGNGVPVTFAVGAFGDVSCGECVAVSILGSPIRVRPFHAGVSADLSSVVLGAVGIPTPASVALE